MSEQQNNVSITILDKTYKVKCPPERISELRESAQYLDSKMREVSHSGKVSGADKIAVIAALNIVHELLLQKRQANTYIDAMSRRIQDLHQKVSTIVSEQDPHA